MTLNALAGVFLLTLNVGLAVLSDTPNRSAAHAAVAAFILGLLVITRIQ